MVEEPTKKPAPGHHREAGTIQNDQHSLPYPTIRSRAKRLIAAAGARGFLPPRLADALIRWGGLRHA